MKALCNVRETAEALSVGRSMVYELMKQGALSSVKIGQRRLVPVKSIEDYVASLTGGPSNG